MMVCKKACALLTAADEGALTGAEKAFYKLHLAICPHCKTYRDQFRATTEALRKLPKEDAPPALVDLLADTLKNKS